MGLSVGLGVPSQVPVGVVSAFAGVNAPAGWLMCAGQAISRTDYSALFTALSTTYGSGDGSTTFNLPDLRGRVHAGVDDMGGTAASRLTSTVLSASNTLGATGGAQTHTLDGTQIPAHSHPNTLGSNIVAATSHTHGSSTMTTAMNLFNAAGTNYIDYAERGGTSFTETERMYWPSGGADASHNEGTTTGLAIFGSTDANSSSTTVSITNANNTGGGGAHPITQPTLVLNYIIKATQ